MITGAIPAASVFGRAASNHIDNEGRGMFFSSSGYDKALVAEYGPYAHSLDAMLRHVRTSLETILTL
ncbi:MAG: hypothetical protein NTU83_13575 [Candidatus Hydrogenedentes bacterium]|nr:hypothetical protein [Candidatus Hydrogenedentota bacterium]